MKNAFFNQLAKQIAHCGPEAWNCLISIEKQKFRAEELVDNWHSKIHNIDLNY